VSRALGWKFCEDKEEDTLLDESFCSRFGSIPSVRWTLKTHQKTHLKIRSLVDASSS
jgi:hypothetical protein